MNIFGIEVKSREEKEKEEKAYLHRIFPGGTKQKDAVEQELKAMLPRADSKAVMLYYILVRDAMTGGEGMSFDDAVVQVAKKQRVLKMTPDMLQTVREIMKRGEAYNGEQMDVRP